MTENAHVLPNCHPERSEGSSKTIADVIARTAISREKQSIFIKKQDELPLILNPSQPSLEIKGRSLIVPACRAVISLFSGGLTLFYSNFAKYLVENCQYRWHFVWFIIECK